MITPSVQAWTVDSPLARMEMSNHNPMRAWGAYLELHDADVLNSYR